MPVVKPVSVKVVPVIPLAMVVYSPPLAVPRCMVKTPSVAAGVQVSVTDVGENVCAFRPVGVLGSGGSVE